MCRKKPRMLGVAIALLLGIVACRRTPEENAANAPAKTPTVDAPAVATDARQPDGPAAPPQPPPKPIMPQVKLTEALEATCLVKVDDLLPEGTLADLGGRALDVRTKLSPKLTVLCFWKGDDLYALEQLEKHVAGPYARKGVGVVGINQKDWPSVVRRKLQAAEVTFPCLLDPRGAYFAKIATEGLPRIYLVDGQGKILWFDTEYSRGSERDLLQAIEYVLAQEEETGQETGSEQETGTE